MKYLIIAIITLAFLGFKCNDEKVNETTCPDLVSLLIHQYPTNDAIKYDVDSNSIKVWLHRKNVGADSILEQKTIGNEHFKNYCSLINRFDTTRYSNNCVQDGQVMTLLFSKKDSTYKKINFSNYYHVDLGVIINFINSKVDSTYTIHYDKDKLIKELKNCK